MNDRKFIVKTEETIVREQEVWADTEDEATRYVENYRGLEGVVVGGGFRTVAVEEYRGVFS